MNHRYITVFFCLFALVAGNTVTGKTKKSHKYSRAFYASWGYNQEWYTKSTVEINQPSVGNNYKMIDVEAHDHKGWDKKSIFKQPITIPQYNYRLGLYFNKKQDLAIEINFDHTKYIISDNQQIRLSGTRIGTETNEVINFSEKNGFYYYLNNGANFLLINLVKRLPLYHTSDRKFYLDALGKAGVGPLLPHVENSFFGDANNPHFQFGGWNAGLETAIRATVFKYAFVEFAQKVDYAWYSNLKIAHGGTAKQRFGTYELILTAGVIIPTRPHNPLFTRDALKPTVDLKEQKELEKEQKEEDEQEQAKEKK